jgi:hypothetical protein
MLLKSGPSWCAQFPSKYKPEKVHNFCCTQIELKGCLVPFVLMSPFATSKVAGRLYRARHLVYKAMWPFLDIKYAEALILPPVTMRARLYVSPPQLPTAVL